LVRVAGRQGVFCRAFQEELSGAAGRAFCRIIFVEQPLLKVSNLFVELEQHRILEDISFEVGRGETLAVVGPNGAGKTVLFRTLLGLIPYKGKIEWIPGVKIGYVPQRFSIEPDLPLTVAEFLKLKGGSPKEIETEISSVGFGKEILNQQIGVLSSGQQQRVLIAWALVGNPDILLFDEPTSGIDIAAGETIYHFLHKLQVGRKLTILLISHDLQVVFQHATKVICLDREQICFGPPKQALDATTLARLFGVELEHHHCEHHD